MHVRRVGQGNFSESPFYTLHNTGSFEAMADEVVELMENLKFSEEELVDISNDGEDMFAMVEGSEKWIGRQNLKRKPGIVYADREQRTSKKEHSGEHSLEHSLDSQEEERRLRHEMERGKLGGPATSRQRFVKRTL
ncbi:hypothetical protein V6N13_069337 [Hibiscus sabdariffa]